MALRKSARTVLAIRHVEFENLGLFEDVLREHGLNVEYVDAPVRNLRAVDAANPALLAVLGGPISVNDGAQYPFLRDEMAIVEQRLLSGRPMLGVCLGAQMIALCAGARVHPRGEREIGWAPLELTAAGKASPLGHLSSDIPVLHWHGENFDLPAGAVNLAATRGTPHQAFAMGDAVLGLQFHLEVKGNEIERWLVGHTAEIASTPGIDPTWLRDQTAEYAPHLAPFARAVFIEWLERAEII